MAARRTGLLLLLLALAACSPGWPREGSSATGAAALEPRSLEREILVTLPLAGRGANPAGSSRHQYRSGQDWAVALSTRAQVMELGRRFGLQEVDAWPIHALSVYCVRFRVAGDIPLARLLSDLGQLNYVTHAQPHYSFRTLADHQDYNDPFLDLQYGSGKSALLALHRHTRGASARVGIIDTGVDASHPDLRGRLAAQRDLLPGRPRGDLSHGTAVAGIIGAIADNGEGVVGFAPEASLYVYRACATDVGSQALCSGFALAKALDRAAEDGVDVLNLSLAGPTDPLLGELLSVLTGRGVLVVAATDARNPSPSFPASHPGVIAIFSAGPAGGTLGIGPRQPAASLLHRQDWLSTRAGGGYQFFQGASMAAAAMSGLSALVHTVLEEDRALTLAKQIARGDCPPAPDSPGEASFIAAIHHGLHCAAVARHIQPGTGRGVSLP